MTKRLIKFKTHIEQTQHPDGVRYLMVVLPDGTDFKMGERVKVSIKGKDI